MSAFTLLRILADGHCHPGRELRARCALSGAGLRAALRSLALRGAPVRGIRGRGYRLDGGADLLDADWIAARLRDEAPRVALRVVDECTSTSTLVAQAAAGGAPSGTAIACEYQSAGRGRAGRPWLVRLGASLAFSILWRLPRGPQALSGLSLAAGVAAARALEREVSCEARLPGCAIELKWPNDLLCRGAKLGGILVESSPAGDGGSAVVLGVGVNVSSRPEGTGFAVTDIARCARGAVPARSALLAALVASLAHALEQFGRDGFAPFRDEWLQRHAWQGREVAIEREGCRVAAGRALGVDEHGALLLHSAQGVQSFYSGDVSLRPA